MAGEKCWSQPRAIYNSGVEVEILAIKSSQRMHQGELKEARELVDRALSICRQRGDRDTGPRLLIHLASILVLIGESCRALADLDAASAQLGDSS